MGTRSEVLNVQVIRCKRAVVVYEGEQEVLARPNSCNPGSGRSFARARTGFCYRTLYLHALLGIDRRR